MWMIELHTRLSTFVSTFKTTLRMSRTTGRTAFSIVLLLHLSAFLFSVNAEEEQWSFIVLADWHAAEPFARNPDNKTVWNILYDQIHYVNQAYSGDLVLLPGDSTTGKWDNEEFAKKYIKIIRPNLTVYFVLGSLLV